MWWSRRHHQHPDPLPPTLPSPTLIIIIIIIITIIIIIIIAITIITLSLSSLPSKKDVTKWKPFPRYWPFVLGIHRSLVNSLHKNQWRGALVFSLICAWTNGWVNNRGPGDLRRHRAHYDVTVMSTCAIQEADDQPQQLIFRCRFMSAERGSECRDDQRDKHHETKYRHYYCNGMEVTYYNGAETNCGHFQTSFSNAFP